MEGESADFGEGLAHVPSGHWPKGIKNMFLSDQSRLAAAVRIAMREYETSRGRDADFTMKHVDDFTESVTANVMGS